MRGGVVHSSGVRVVAFLVAALLGVTAMDLAAAPGVWAATATEATTETRDVEAVAVDEVSPAGPSPAVPVVAPDTVPGDFTNPRRRCRRWSGPVGAFGGRVRWRGQSSCRS